MKRSMCSTLANASTKVSLVELQRRFFQLQSRSLDWKISVASCQFSYCSCIPYSY